MVKGKKEATSATTTLTYNVNTAGMGTSKTSNNISQKEQDELRKLRFNNVPEKYLYKPDQDKKNDSTDGGGELYDSDDKKKR